MNKEAVKLFFYPAYERTDLLCQSIQKFLSDKIDKDVLEKILVAEIDPKFAGGRELCNHYSIPFERGANCVVIEARRAQTTQIAACLYPVGSRVDMNKVVRKKLNSRRISLAPIDEIIEKTGMEYGSITPLGLPNGWPGKPSTIDVITLIQIGEGI